MTDILNDCGWPLCSALNLYLTLCTVSKKSSFFVNCVYCQRSPDLELRLDANYRVQILKGSEAETFN